MLHENGLGEFVAFEWGLSVLGGLVLALLVYRSRKEYVSRTFYRVSLASTGLLFIFPFLLLGLAFIGVMFFGVTV